MADDWAGRAAPSLAQIEALADAAAAALPDGFRAAAAGVLVRVADFADADTLDAMEMEDPFELTGLYEGVPMTHKSVMDQPDSPDVIWLFRRPILEEWVARGDVALGELVTHVYIHELAHHLGWSDADIATVDRWWE